MHKRRKTHSQAVVYSYADACRIIFNTIRTSGHSSLEKFTSYFIEKVVCERELETEQRLQHIDPQTLLAITAFLSRSPVMLNRGPGGPSLCWNMVLISASSLQLIWTSYHRGYIIIWRPPTSCERHNSHSIQSLDSQGRPLSPDIFERMHLLLHRCISSFDSLAGSEINMQQSAHLQTHKHLLMVVPCES